MQKNSPPTQAVPGPQSALFRFVFNAFILPFRDRSRAYVYFASFFFALGSAFLDIFISLDTAHLGATQLAHFLLGKFGAIIILIPLGLYGIGRLRDVVLFPLFLGVMIAGLGFILMQGGHVTPLGAGILYAVAVSPFWACYHVMFASATSDANIGNEVSLAGTGMTVGMTFGYMLGGLCSQFHLEAPGMVMGFVIVTGSTAALVIKAMRTGFSKALRESGAMDESLWQALRRCKYRSAGSLFEGIFQLPGGNLWIVYLSMAGIGAGVVGAWQGVMVLAKVVVTPFAGALVNHGRRREMLFGAGLNLFGWSPFLFGAASGFVLLFMNVWAVGIQLFSTGLTSAWYGSRTVAAIIVREIILGIGRIATVFFFVPLVYREGHSFIAVTLVLALAMFIYAVLWMLRINMKGPVLPIENIVTRQ